MLAWNGPRMPKSSLPRATSKVSRQVGTPSLTIYDPSPFIEILDKAADVDQQHFPVFTRSGLVGMYDDRIGTVHGTGNAVDTTRKIDILGVHEIALVEKPRLFQRPDSQEHERS